MTKERKSGWRRFLAGTWKYFLTGMTVIVPLAGAVALLVFVFVKLDNILQPEVGDIIRWFNPDFTDRIPGLGLVAAILLILAAGVIASNYAGRVFLKSMEAMLVKVPLFRQLYLGAQQVTKSITGLSVGKAAFRRVVFVECGAQ